MKSKSLKKEKLGDKLLKPTIIKYRGILNLPPNYDYKKAISQYLLDKYNNLK